MPIPSANFDNTVVVVEGSPVGPTEINAMLAIWNANGFWMTSLEFITGAEALLLFVKFDAAAYGYTADQHVNLVDYTQAALDADKAAEIVNGFWPTGIFVTPIADEGGREPLILYQRLDYTPV